jgi:hypothetical protein
LNLSKKGAIVDRKSYQKTMEEELTRLSAKIGELLGRAEATAKNEYDKQMKTLPEKLKVARAKLDELQKSSGEAWEDLRPGLEKAWAELKTSFEKAASRFK